MLRLLGALLVLLALALAYFHLHASGLLQQILDVEWLRWQALALGARGRC